MGGFLEWLQGLPLSVWVAESESIWAYPFILFLHTMGIALSAGCGGIVLMRVVGVASPVPLKSVRTLLPWFWTGLILNAISGILLFDAAASATGSKPIYYVKMLLIVGALVTLLPVRRFLLGESEPTDGAVPARIRILAVASLLLWAGVVTTGRLIAYVQ